MFAVVVFHVAVAADYGAPEPYSWLHGFDSEAAPAVSSSPDPLIRYKWTNISTSVLQQYATDSAVAVFAEPPQVPQAG